MNGLFDVKFDVIFDVTIFMVRRISLRKDFWVVNAWRAPVRRRFKRSTLNFPHKFLKECFTRGCPHFFLKINYPLLLQKLDYIWKVTLHENNQKQIIQKYLKRWELPLRFCLSIDSLHVSEKWLLKATTLLEQGIIKKEKW